ncbi:hypothetical protein [Nonomuraea sp. NPDC002799]
MSKRRPQDGIRRNKRTSAVPKRLTSGDTDASTFALTKHDVSVAPKSLSKGWQAFAEQPDETTAKALAKTLRDLSPAEARTSLDLIARALAKGSAFERSTMSRLIMSQLDGDVARGFLQATAGVRLATAEAVREEPGPQHEDLRHQLDLLPPPVKGAKLPQTLGGRDRLLLEGLDLAASGEVTVDLAEVEQHTDDVLDASSMGHLVKALDFIKITSSKDTYSQQRRAALADTVKGTTQQHLAEQMGFRAARSQRADKGGLSVQNQLAVTYWRTNFRDTLPGFLSKLQVAKKDEDILVNSPRVLRQLAMLVSEDVLKTLTIKALDGKSGISLLSGTEKHPLTAWKGHLDELGATPSAYQLYELMDTGRTPPPSDFTVDTRADLVELITSGPFSRLQEIARGTGELAPVCAMAEHLVLGLTGELGPKRFDTLTATALDSLSRLMHIVVTHEKNPSVAMRAVDLMMDEIGLVVAVAQNYTRTDYRETMRQILLERAPSIASPADARIQLDSHLVTSGMNALGTALSIALTVRDQQQVSRATEKIDYYETGELIGKLKKGETVAPREDVLVAALNPSTPFVTPSAGGLVSDVRRALETYQQGDPPFALILDTTIELAPAPTEQSQLDVVLGGLKNDIATGRLEVFLCKSFQKYASFGTGKVAAGDLTLLSMKGNRASAIARAEALLQDLDLDLARHDEGQLVIHMLRHGHGDELALARSAAANAKFVDEFCWPIDRLDTALGSSYVDGIPLLMRSTPTGRVGKLLEDLALIDRRDSFSFLRTSFVGGIPGPWGSQSLQENWYARINPGHESKETMVECFYAFGHLATSTLPGGDKGGTPVDLNALQLATVGEHLQRVRTAGDAGIARFRANIMASYCVFAMQNVRPKGSVVPLLIAFFAGPTDRVSIETQRHLAGELFSQVQAKIHDPQSLTNLSRQALAYLPQGATADAATSLAALSRAAMVLPTWSFKPYAVKLQLDQIGGSTEAARLRELVKAAL